MNNCVCKRVPYHVMDIPMQRSSLKILSEGMVRLVFPKVNCRSNAYCSGVRSMKSKSACERVPCWIFRDPRSVW